MALVDAGSRCLRCHDDDVVRVLASCADRDESTADVRPVAACFFASQLGKYIPGKAMVVVIRTDLIRNEKVRTAPAAASVFVETLTWIFVGSLIGGTLVVICFPDQQWLKLAAIAMACMAGMLTWPSVFQWIASRLTRTSHPSENFFAGLNLGTMGFGWFIMSIGWALNGLSLWLVLKGLPGLNVTMADYGLALTCVTLATVAGFVSLLPGGLGVRELVMIPLLGARFDPATAIIAAVAIRLVWLFAELMTSGNIYLVRRLIWRVKLVARNE